MPPNPKSADSTDDDQAAAAAQRVVVVGDVQLVQAVFAEFRRQGRAAPTIVGEDYEAALAAALVGATQVIIATRSDPLALKLVLLVRDRSPEIDVVVTAFDRTLAGELAGPDLRSRVMPSADLIAAVIAGPCARQGVRALTRGLDGGVDELTLNGEEVIRRRHKTGESARHRVVDRIKGAARPYDASARILVVGVVGLLATLVVDVIVGIFALDEGLGYAVYVSMQSLTAVDGNEAVREASTAVRTISTFTLVMALVSTAFFAAGLVSRIVEPRRVGILGRRALPVGGHVIIVGMGQIGLRTALLLRDAGIPVVGVDRDERSVGVRLGAAYGLPIVIADGEDRRLLARLHARRARCVAAVTSDDLVNIEVAMAARAVRRDLRVVLRAGDGQIARETRALLHLGVVCDANHTVAIGLACAGQNEVPAVVLPADDGGSWTTFADGSCRRWK